MSTERVCTLVLDEITLAVPVDRVAEVLLDQDAVPVPRAHPCVVGMFNLRGEVVTAVDLRRRLDLPARPDGAAVVHVIVRVDGEPMSLVVDREGEVLDVDPDAWTEIPHTVGAPIRGLTAGAQRVGDDLLLLLDPDGALALTAP